MFPQVDPIVVLNASQLGPCGVGTGRVPPAALAVSPQNAQDCTSGSPCVSSKCLRYGGEGVLPESRTPGPCWGQRCWPHHAVGGRVARLGSGHTDAGREGAAVTWPPWQGWRRPDTRLLLGDPVAHHGGPVHLLAPYLCLAVVAGEAQGEIHREAQGVSLPAARVRPGLEKNVGFEKRLSGPGSDGNSLEAIIPPRSQPRFWQDPTFSHRPYSPALCARAHVPYRVGAGHPVTTHGPMGPKPQGVPETADPWIPLLPRPGGAGAAALPPRTHGPAGQEVPACSRGSHACFGENTLRSLNSHAQPRTRAGGGCGRVAPCPRRGLVWVGHLLGRGHTDKAGFVSGAGACVHTHTCTRSPRNRCTHAHTPAHATPDTPTRAHAAPGTVHTCTHTRTRSPRNRCTRAHMPALAAPGTLARAHAHMQPQMHLCAPPHTHAAPGTRLHMSTRKGHKHRNAEAVQYECAQHSQHKQQIREEERESPARRHLATG